MAFQLNKEGNATAPVPESASGIVDPMATENQEVDNGQAKDAGTDVVKPEMLGKVFDFPKLPNEIKNMIFETAAHYNPAVVYAELKVSSDDSDYPKKVRFISGPLQRWSEFRDLRNLSEAIPEFCCFLESKIGQTFKQLGKRPTNALRGNMDILVISLRANAKSINWTAQGVLAGFKYREHGIQEPKARNIGLSLAASALAGMGCQAGCNHRNSSPLCPLKLAMFAKNFSHLENVFVLVKLRPGDVYPTASSARASLKMLMKKMLREARRQDLAVFDDTVRTWIEIPKSDAYKYRLSCLDGVFELLRAARKPFLDREQNLAKPNFPKRKVRFRVLVASWYLR